MVSRILDGYARAFQRFMPSPFSIAVLLTVVTAVLSLRHAAPEEVLGAWVQGLWSPGLIRFGFQAMFMLVLGHVLALAPPVLRLLNRAVAWVVSQPSLVAPKVALLSMALGWLNWGFGLVGGAILVRGVLDQTRTHPGLLGAAGYTGMLVWHGGLGGSAPLKVAETGHMRELVAGSPEWARALPEAIGLRETVFSGWSLGVTLAVVLVTVCLFYALGRVLKVDDRRPNEPQVARPLEQPGESRPAERAVHGWADRLDGGPLLAWALGLAALAGAMWWAREGGPWQALKFVTPDWINLVLLGAALVAHGSVKGLLQALEEAIGGAAGILIQFPLYFGIMGMVTATGLGTALAAGLVSATSADWLPVALFASSGVLNVFVPSGGGQWAVQGPLVLASCMELGVPLPRGIMAMAFGDALTNMLQPFWALPLLGITGLKARDILPYTLLLMGVAGAVMTVAMFLG